MHGIEIELIATTTSAPDRAMLARARPQFAPSTHRFALLQQQVGDQNGIACFLSWAFTFI